MSSPRSLNTAVLVCHGILTLAVAGLAYSATSSALLGAVLALLAALPLLATFRPLATSPGARPWAALLLVCYAGATSIEVVATLGAARFASVALLIAILELGLLLVVIRRARAQPRVARG